MLWLPLIAHVLFTKVGAAKLGVKLVILYIVSCVAVTADSCAFHTYAFFAFAMFLLISTALLSGCWCSRVLFFESPSLITIHVNISIEQAVSRLKVAVF